MTFVSVSLPEAHKNGEALYAQLWLSHAVNEPMLGIIGIAPAFSEQHVSSRSCSFGTAGHVELYSHFLPETTGGLL